MWTARTFATLADLLGLTAGNLSRNLTVLEEHGYVVIEKTFQGRRPRTWVQATGSGKAAEASRARTCPTEDDGRLHGRELPAGAEFELCFEAADVDVTAAELRRLGAPELAPPTDMPWGERVACFADPDGLRIHIYGPVPEGARAQT